MKKLSLNEPMVQKGEVLSRAQLKKVLGGDGSGDSGSDAGYLVETTCTITENGHQSVCWCALTSDFEWHYGLCRNIDNMA